MRHLDPRAFPDPSLEALVLFLRQCREQARADAHAKLVSISLPVRHIEPLSVLDSIFEVDAQHFYLERPDAALALAGAETVWGSTFSGPGRFAAVRAFADEVLEHTIHIGDPDYPGAGPHFFCGFTFGDTVPSGSCFEPASVFVPRWQVARNQGYYTAVANLRIEPEGDIEAAAQKVWAAHQKFSRFDYSHEPERPVATGELAAMREAGGEGKFEGMVRASLERISRGEFEKIVLARAIDLDRTGSYAPLSALARLREQFAGCYAFSFANGKGQSFIGATPERLLQIQDGVLRTMALAGTARRGATPREDASLARELLESEKDLREHRVVIESIRRRLKRFGLELPDLPPPRLMQLSNVQHLLTPISIPVGDRHDLLDLLSELHPTPAVGGSPRAVTTGIIGEIEPFDRGLYAGALGFFDFKGNGEMVVAIRSALIDGSRARVYAGSGIVEGSDPEKEKLETDLKLKAILPSLEA